VLLNPAAPRGMDSATHFVFSQFFVDPAIRQKENAVILEWSGAGFSYVPFLGTCRHGAKNLSGFLVR